MRTRTVIVAAWSLAICCTTPALATSSRTDSPAEKRCPVCVGAAVVGGIALEDVIAGAVVAGGAAAVIHHAVSKSHAAERAARVAAHPKRHRGAIRAAKHRRRVGRHIWRKAKGEIRKVARYFKHRYTPYHLRRRLPEAAIACVTSGGIVYLQTWRLRAARDGCVGGAAAAMSR